MPFNLAFGPSKVTKSMEFESIEHWPITILKKPFSPQSYRNQNLVFTLFVFLLLFIWCQMRNVCNV